MFGKKKFEGHANMEGIQPTGAFISIDPCSGWITGIFICCHDDREQRICEGVLARVARPDVWAWLNGLIGRD